MTKKNLWILGLSLAAAGGVGVWIWWRQKDAVPPSAVPIMQQYRATMGATPTVQAGLTESSLVASTFPTDIALPSNSTT